MFYNTLFFACLPSARFTVISMRTTMTLPCSSGGKAVILDKTKLYFNGNILYLETMGCLLTRLK